MIFGIDVSKWQSGVLWDRVPADIEFAIARASISKSADTWYAVNARGISDTGRLGGAYHYLYPDDGAGQASFFLDTVGDPEGKLCVVDVERAGTTFNDVEAFASRFAEEAPGHPLIVYTGKWFWASSSFGNPRGSDIGPLWHSHYVNPTQALGKSPQEIYSLVPSTWWNTFYGGWPRATILQYTSSSSVPGVSTRCDANAFKGTIDELRKLATTQEENPKVLAATDVTASVVVTIPKGTQLYDLNRRPIVKMSRDATVLSVGRSGDDDVVAVTTAGVRQFLLVRTSTVTGRASVVDEQIKILTKELADANAKIQDVREIVCE